MKTVLIQRFTEEEQEFNTRLLSTFETMFSANSFNNLKGILHLKRTYFRKLKEIPQAVVRTKNIKSKRGDKSTLVHFQDVDQLTNFLWTYSSDKLN